MSTPEEILAKVPLFSMLSKREVAKLAKEAHDRTFLPGSPSRTRTRRGRCSG